MVSNFMGGFDSTHIPSRQVEKFMLLIIEILVEIIHSTELNRTVCFANRVKKVNKKIL